MHDDCMASWLYEAIGTSCSGVIQSVIPRNMHEVLNKSLATYSIEKFVKNLQTDDRFLNVVSG